MIHRLLQQCALTAILALGLDSSVVGETLSVAWKTDCVGRMQISLPGDADIAAMLPKDLAAKISSKWANDEPYKFRDGQPAGWSSSGLLRITHPMTAEEVKTMDAAIDKDKKSVKDYLKQREAETGQSHPLTDLPAHGAVKAAWRGRRFYEAFFYMDGVVARYLVTAGDGPANNMNALTDYYSLLLAGLRSRQTFNVPEQSGVCLQHAFQQDDGKDSRHVGITYRLKDHPDITIWLEDSSAAHIASFQDPAKFTAEYKAAFFWEQDYQNRQSFKSLWPLHRAFKPTTLAGYKGVKTFVELTRRDGVTRDYGYLVAVRGDPAAKEDTPDLMLSVIQDSENASKRGITPIGKDAFLEMPETIAASVKRRPVVGH